MKNYLFLPAALLAMVTLAGCSSTPESNMLLDEARSDYRQAERNPQVTKLASSELKQASDALDKANEASSKNEDEATINHLAYLAKQQTAIAQATARQKAAEATVESAGMHRNATRLEARTEEANRAQQSADESQRQTAIAQEQAAMSQQQTRAAQMHSSKLETELKELNAKKTERGMVITLGDVLFDTNKAGLKSGGTRSLQKLAAFLKQYPERMVLIEGYTDSTGSTEYNLGLSERRARSVQSALMNMGINRDRINTRGYGEASPAADNTTVAGRQMNRRVEIVLPDEMTGR